ncbi:hypothetical protein DFH06DRAFT_1325846 [Mycena polygramma]|nr:hypothetical protein DFH06DRAFT_1325846 [Mycena polygramma]
MATTTSDVDMTEEEILDYGDDEIGEEIIFESDSTGDEPLGSDSGSDTSGAGSNKDAEVRSDEPVKKATEEAAQTESLRGGDEERDAMAELKKLRDEVFSLRKQRDIATHMSKTARQELGQMSAELRSERRRGDAKEDQLDAMRQKLDEGDDERDGRSRERARSKDQRRRSRSARSRTPTARTKRSRSPEKERQSRSRSPIRTAARSRTPVARSSTTPLASRGRARTPTGPRNREPPRAQIPSHVHPITRRQPLPHGSTVVLSPNLGMRDPEFDSEEQSRFAYAAKRFGTVTPPQRHDYEVDARGYPVDKHGWWTTFKLQQNGQSFVHGLRHLHMWAYARDVPESERTELQQLSIQHYEMTDWFAGRLSLIDIYRTENTQEIREWHLVRRELIKYNPELLAQFFQYREMTVRSCRFTDDAWSLNDCDVRPENLRNYINLAHRRTKTEGAPTDDERLIRYLVDKHIFTMFITPGLYNERLRALKIKPAKEFALAPWPDHTNTNVTLDDVVVRLSECGVCVALIDDAFVYALHWCEDTTMPLPWGWDATAVAQLAEEASRRTAPPHILPREIWTRTPCLPWIRNSENIIQFEMSHWRQPELAGMRRPKGSAITKQLLLTPINEAPNLGLLRPNNPYLRSLGPQIPGLSAADAAIILARNGITKKSTNRRSTTQGTSWINSQPHLPSMGFRSDGDRSMAGSIHAPSRSGPSLLTRMSLPAAAPSSHPRVSLPAASPSPTARIDDDDATMIDASEDLSYSLPQGSKFVFGTLESLPPPTPEELAVQQFAFGLIHGNEINRYCDYDKDYVSRPAPM